MLLISLFFIASFFVGQAILEATQIILVLPIRHIIAVVLGIITNTLIIFGTSFVFGLNLVNVLAVISLPFLLSVIFLFKKADWQTFFEGLEVRNHWLVLLGFSVLIIFIIILFFKSIYVDSQGITAGNRLVWTDWPVHLAIISSFVHGNNFPPQNPLYAGQLISYPFFADFLSAILQILGAGLKTSLVVPGILLALSSISLLYYLGTLLVERKSTVIIGIFVGLFWGGLGFWYFFQDLVKSSNFWATLTFPPYEYTFYQEKNLWFFSFLYSELIPQRSFLFGLPMFLISLILLIIGISQHKKTYLLLAGYLTAIMPFFHMHSYISLLLLSSIFIPLTILISFFHQGFKKAKEQLAAVIFYFLLPIIGLGLIQLPFFLSLNLNQTIGLNFGWMEGKENFFLFWFKNTGFFWPLMLFAFWKTKLSTLTKTLAVSSILFFVLSNIFRFAPWSYDNLKIMTFWYFIGAFLVAKSLVYFYQKNYLGKILAVFLFITLTFSGIIEVTRVFNTQKVKINLWSKDDIELANTIIAKTEPNSVILTAAIHDHPVTALAGRRIIIGFPGNAWSWGLTDWAQREADVHTLLKADQIYMPYLLKKYKVDYVLISPREKYFEPAVNEQYFSQNAKFIVGGENYKLYQIE